LSKNNHDINTRI